MHRRPQVLHAQPTSAAAILPAREPNSPMLPGRLEASCSNTCRRSLFHKRLSRCSGCLCNAPVPCFYVLRDASHIHNAPEKCTTACRKSAPLLVVPTASPTTSPEMLDSDPLATGPGGQCVRQLVRSQLVTIEPEQQITTVGATPQTLRALSPPPQAFLFQAIEAPRYEFPTGSRLTATIFRPLPVPCGTAPRYDLPAGCRLTARGASAPAGMDQRWPSSSQTSFVKPRIRVDRTDRQIAER